MRASRLLLALVTAPGCLSDATPGKTLGPGEGLEADREAGVDTPWLIPAGTAAARAPVRRGPRRAGGYGRGEGTVAYPEVTPDGSALVVMFQALEGGSSLYALATDGSDADSPVEVARGTAIDALARDYAELRVAYVDQGDLFAAPLDGSGASSPTLVARAGSGRRIEAPRWVGSEEIAYHAAPIGGGPTAQVARSDGSEADAPRSLSCPSGAIEHLAAVLPSGLLIGRGADDRLWAIQTTPSEPRALTPAGPIPSFAGASADGTRVVVELRTTWNEERELVTVAVDGSEAGAPIVLTTAPRDPLRDRRG